MVPNKAIAGGVVGLTSGMSGGITPLLQWLCVSAGLPDDVCMPLTTWMGPFLTAVVSGVVVYVIPNKERAVTS